ncbi:MAG: polyketide synthase [Myxococcales bacterium]|nr:polyketide synthase [Myxococcales bacterium]
MWKRTPTGCQACRAARRSSGWRAVRRRDRFVDGKRAPERQQPGTAERRAGQQSRADDEIGRVGQQDRAEAGGQQQAHRLEDARRDGDKVYAVIRGIGAACDARSLIAPDVEGQALAIRRAFAEVPYAPSTVDFVETHGTGTTLGDQIEVLSLALTYGDERRATPLVLGSVKSMIGHTFAAAGAAGLLKTVLALGARVLPPNVAFDPLNPHLALPQVPARVLGTPELWPQSSHPRRAGVSAFGTGGINYHVLIEEPEAP